MSVYYDTKLAVKLRSELKGAYLALCKSQGVTASEKLREFIAKEVAEGLQDGRQVKVARTAATKKTDSPQDDNAGKCVNTDDMFKG